MTDLEYGSLLQHIAARCHSSLGRSEAAKLKPLDCVGAMRASQELIAEFQAAQEDGLEFDFSLLTKLDDFFEEIGVFDFEELREIAINADLGTRMRGYHESFGELPLAQSVVKKLYALPRIMQGFNRIFDLEGEVMDSASAELMRIRKSMNSMRNRIQRNMEELLSGPRFENFLQDKFVTQRDDRFVLPIKESAASFVSGIVQSRSGSKSTVFIEPAEIVPLNNELQLLKEEEKREIYRILSEFSEEICSRKREILRNQQILARLDHLFATARLCNTLRCQVPKLSGEPVLDFRAARHPLLILNKISAGGKNAYHQVIPFDLRLGQDYKLMILSGPNTGGKTVLMKAVGLITLMALSGLPIPADEESTVGRFSRVSADIGDDQSIESALSTFSSHLEKIGRMIAQADEDSLILIDEIGAATDPQQGSALAQAILERLAELGVKGIVTTHYTALKVFAESNENCVNASMQFDMDSLQPTYRFSTGIPGDSFAIEVAASMGLGENLIKRARSLAGSQNIEFSSLIKRMQEEKKDLATQSYQYRLKRRNLEARLNELEEREAQWQKELKGRRQKHLREMQQELISFQKLYNKEISELKSLERQERKRLSERKLHDISMKSEELSRQIRKSSADGKSRLSKPKIGDKVWLANFETDAIIIAIDRDEATVDMNGISFKTPLDSLYRSSDEAKKPEPEKHLYRVKATPRVQTELKLLGLTFDEAMPLIDEFLDNAQMSGFSTLRIVHGKGTGALRSKVRDYLSRKKIVKGTQTPPFYEGGDGVTVVKI